MANISVFILAPDFPRLEDCEMIGGAYADSLAAAKRMGYDGVEIVMGDPDSFDPDAFRTLLSAQELKVSAINCGAIQYLFKAGLVDIDVRRMEFAFEKLKCYIRHCQALGCIQQIGVARGLAVPGRPMRWFKDCLVDVLKRVADYAAGLGVPIAFEYTNRFEINTINTAAEAREIVDRVGSPNIGVLVDTYHSFLEDPDVCQNIRDLNGRVRYFHLHDSNRGAAMISGGENDFDRIVHACSQIQYRNWFSDGLLTLRYSEDELRRSTSRLHELFKEHGI
jgi:D-psicose/D-tagatose/L-ribulose 3-epimerase